MTEKKAEPAYIITESELKTITHGTLSFARAKHGDDMQKYMDEVGLSLHKVRSRPHNPAPAIISVEPHPPGKEQLACDNTCPARCPVCEDTCPLWEHDEQVKREAREEVLNKLKDDLKTRFVSSSNQWSNGRNSGLLECGNIIDDYLRSEVKKP